MAREWTKEQLDAISSRNGSVLVSAAAGSGKTAVLVERVIRRLTDERSPSRADRLLIVTFTRAAASEMRTRISKAIEEELRKNPTNERLAKQRMLLPSAKICTIDSFCNSLVRENFERLEISPDFKNADEGELALLSSQAMTLALEELYLQNDEGFTDLVELLFRGRDDSFLSEMILEIYNKSMSYPFPERWLRELCGDYEESGDEIENNRFVKILTEYALEAVSYCKDILSSMRKIVSGCEELEKAYLKVIESDGAQLEYIGDRQKNGSWDEARSAILNFEAVRRSSVSKDVKDSFDVKLLNSSRDTLKEIVIKKLGPMFCSSKAEFVDDMRFFEPMVKNLCKAVTLYSKHFSALKKEKKLADFNDVAHLALSLLVRETENGFERTELALAMKDSFDEILIDEYQDTNKAQDMLFSALSNNNLFRVGDVKQSIYRFRQAMPEIFIELKNSLAPYEREKDNYPSKIILKNNFRSRKSVTGCVNFVFSQLMSENMGGIDYNDEEKLVFSAPYSERSDDCAELHLLETGEFDTSEVTKNEYAAAYTAGLVDRLVESGFKVSDGNGGERPVQYKDICILLRSVSSGKGARYAEALKKRGIPCFTQLDAEFFSSSEVGLILNLLRVIDNPKQDIPLLSVLMSPLFGFSSDDCAELRIGNRSGNLYSCLLSSAESGKRKSKAVLEKLNSLRRLGVCSGVSDFVRSVYDETGIDSLARSLKDSGAKRENLMLLLDYADIYEKAGYSSLSGFVRFVDRLERAKGDLQGAAGVSAEANVVRIMTIHKSKGLEFPVCILADCNSKFNLSDENKNAVVSSNAGLGLIRRDSATMAQYPTLCHKAVKRALRADTVSEEMRVLYVALTRAKEKLIMVGAVKDAQKAALSCGMKLNNSRRTVTPFACSLSGSYLEWLLTALLRHRDAKELRERAELGEDIVLESDFSLKLVLKNEADFVPEREAAKERATPDAEIERFLEERLSWRYKYEKLAFVVSKRAASEVDKRSVDREYFASSRPAFLSDSLTGAQRGIATHSFMQFANYENAKRDLEKEINAVFERGLITEKERDAINRKHVSTFFESGLSKRLLKSPLVMREKKFTVSVPVSEVYPELSEFSEEEVMIQGIADCAFLEDDGLVVVDYKTDALKSEEEFVEKYREQVKTYKRALELCTGFRVKQTLLYSFSLGKEIEIDG